MTHVVEATGGEVTDPRPADVWQVTTQSAEATRLLGERLGALATAGTVVLLRGELGAGKTVVAQGVGRGLGVAGVINSPTFVLVNEHLSGRLPLLHADLYRLERLAEIAELTLDEVAADGVLLVEWPERSEEPIAEDCLIVTIVSGPGEADRRLHWETTGERSAALLGLLRNASGTDGGTDGGSNRGAG